MSSDLRRASLLQDHGARIDRPEIPLEAVDHGQRVERLVAGIPDRDAQRDDLTGLHVAARHEPARRPTLQRLLIARSRISLIQPSASKLVHTGARADRTRRALTAGRAV